MTNAMSIRDVTHDHIAINSDFICINEMCYDKADFEQYVNGKAVQLLQSSEQLCIVILNDDNSYQKHLINQRKDIQRDDSFITTFYFKPYKLIKAEKHMTEQNRVEKVVGTTFHPLKENQKIEILEVHKEQDIEVATAVAVLMPEPTNEYDKEAVQVIVKLTTGEPFALGYLPAKSPYKSLITGPTKATVTIQDYQPVGDYNIAYTVRF